MLVFIKLPPEDQTETRTHHYSHIECDVCGCRSPSADAMLRSHGLSNMGWFIAGGIHRCPDHYTDATEPRGPEYRDA